MFHHRNSFISIPRWFHIETVLFRFCDDFAFRDNVQSSIRTYSWQKIKGKYWVSWIFFFEIQCTSSTCQAPATHLGIIISESRLNATHKNAWQLCTKRIWFRSYCLILFDLASESRILPRGTGPLSLTGLIFENEIPSSPWQAEPLVLRIILSESANESTRICISKKKNHTAEERLCAVCAVLVALDRMPRPARS